MLQEVRPVRAGLQSLKSEKAVWMRDGYGQFDTGSKRGTPGSDGGEL